MDLRTEQKIQDRVFKNNALGTTEQPFSVFVATHPSLYEGIQLDKATIDYLNLYFFEYSVNPQTFERHYITALKRYAPMYNNLKAIEVIDDIFDTCTNKIVRKLARETVNNLERNGNANTASTGSKTNITDEDNSTDRRENGNNNSNQSFNNKSNNTKATISKEADRNLPMVTTGQNFDQTVQWDAGASNIRQVNNNDTDVNIGSGASNDSTIFRTNISQDDTNHLKSVDTLANNVNTTTKDSEIGTGTLQDDEVTEIIGDQVSNIIKNIWDYLVSDKSIDYLTEHLKHCFILVY